MDYHEYLIFVWYAIWACANLANSGAVRMAETFHFVVWDPRICAKQLPCETFWVDKVQRDSGFSAYECESVKMCFQSDYDYAAKRFCDSDSLSEMFL